MGQRIVQVDAFTERCFAGNPAAVCVLDAPAPDAWMAALAREMNLSETAFVLREDAHWRLRWFTPAVEVDLCGHATLATAHVLWEEGHAAPDETLRFESRSGPLHAHRRGDWVELDFPATPATPGPPPAGLLAALGLDTARSTARSRFDWLVEVDDPADVRGLSPDFGALGRVDARGVIVTSPADAPGFDFISRFFAPRAGVDEDPVTGSAHCTLAPWWADRLGRTELTGFQASRRGGAVRVAVRGDRVGLAGRAFTVLRGELTAAASAPRELS